MPDHLDTSGVSMTLLRPLALSVRRLGGSVEDFSRALGVEGAADEFSYVPTERVARALDELGARLSEPHIGLALARATPFGSLTFIDYCAVASPNLGVALARTARYYALLTTRAALSLEIAGDEATLAQRARTDRAHLERQLTEFRSASCIFAPARGLAKTSG